MSVQLRSKVIDKFLELTEEVPGFLHFDSIGFFRLATKKNNIFETLNSLFHSVKDSGGNLLIPSYSYSYTKNEVYSVKDSESSLGQMSDYLRKNNPELRTSDAIFSYLAFSNLVSKSFFSPVNYESFGPSSLIAEVFNSNGYLISVGNRLHYSTEIHLLEKLLNVEYRLNKNFPGKILTLENEIHDQVITYFCRDLDFANKYNAIVSFERLFKDMTDDGLVEEYVIEDMIEISTVRFQAVFSYLKEKMLKDSFYLMKDRTTSMPIRI